MSTQTQPWWRAALPWMPIALIGAAAVRVVGWLTLRQAAFTGAPAYNDAIHQTRALSILHGGFPEGALPWGSPFYPYVTALVWSIAGESASLVTMIPPAGSRTAHATKWRPRIITPSMTAWPPYVGFSLNGKPLSRMG